MGIHLDWEVESDSGHEAVNEDAEVIAARQRKQVWSKRALIVVAVLAIIGGAIAAYRIREVRTAMRESLNAIVESESLALRLGDKRKFMAIQGPAEDWRAKQRQTFDLFQEAGLAISVTGTILDIEMKASEARVTVEVLVNSEPTEAIWLYEYSVEDGWRHVATESEPWTMSDHEGEWFTMSYFPVDADYAHLVESYLNAWWEQASQATGYRYYMPELTVVIDPDAEHVEWQGDGLDRLIVPAIYETTSHTPLLDMERLADSAAEYWTMTVYGEEVPAFARWLKNETETWFEDMFVPQPNLDAHIFASLQEAYGDKIIKDFFKIRRDDDAMPVLAMRQAIAENAPKGNLQGEALNRYLTAILRAEAYMEQATNDNVARWDSSVGQIFLDAYVPGDSFETFMLTYDAAKPETMQVLSTEMSGDLLWARVRFEPMWTETGELFDTFVPFRATGGKWVHTYLRSSDSGGTFVERGTNVTLIYDNQSREMAAGLMPLLETLHAQTARTFGIEGMPVTFVLQAASFQYAGSGAADTIYLHSPYWVCCLAPDQTATDYAHKTAATEIINMMYNAKLGPDNLSTGQNPIDLAILETARERAGLAPTDYFWGQEIIPFAFANVPVSTRDLWLPDQGWYDERSRYENYARVLAGQALIDVLIAQYGEDVMPLLVNARPYSISTDEWLIAALGITSAEIDGAWWARYQELMEVQFGDTVLNEYITPGQTTP